MSPRSARTRRARSPMSASWRSPASSRSMAARAWPSWPTASASRTVTIRKDLEVLADGGRVIRTHGGAIAARVRREDLTYEVRDQMQREEKAAIGALAAAQVGDGESILIDASTTGLYLARELMQRGAGHSLTIVTNSIRMASELAVARTSSCCSWAAACVGDRSRWWGSWAMRCCGRVNVQKAFVGAAGFTLEEGLTETHRGGGTDQARHGGRGPRGLRHRRSQQMGTSGLGHVLRAEGLTARLHRRRRTGRHGRLAPGDGHRGDAAWLIGDFVTWRWTSARRAAAPSWAASTATSSASSRCIAMPTRRCAWAARCTGTSRGSSTTS